MRATGLLASVALLATAGGIAQAGFGSEYQGSVRDGGEGRLGLDREKRAGKPVIGRVYFDFATECQSGDSQANGSMSGFVQVRKGEFEAKRSGTSFSDMAGDDEVSVKFAGKVVSQRVVRGTIRVNEIRREGAAVDRCSSGKRSFRVERLGGQG